MPTFVTFELWTFYEINCGGIECMLHHEAKRRRKKRCVMGCMMNQKRRKRLCHHLLVEWTVAKSLVHLDKFAEIFLQKKHPRSESFCHPFSLSHPQWKKDWASWLLCLLGYYDFYFLSVFLPSQFFPYTYNPHFMNCHYLLWLKHTPIFQLLI